MSVPSANNTNPEELFALGLKASRQRDLEVAVAYYEKVFSIDPNYSLIDFYLGITLFLMNPKDNSKFGQKAIFHLERSLESPDIDKEQEVRALVALSWLYRLSQEDSDKSLLLAERATSVIPNNAIAWESLGRAAYGIDEEKSFEAFEKSVQLDPSLYTAWEQLGQLHQAKGDERKALHAYEKAVSLDPSLANSWANIGFIYGIQRDFEQAIGALTKAIELDPNTVQYWQHLGIAYRELGDDNKAIEAFERALIVDPTFTQALNDLILCYYTSANLNKVIHTANRMLEADPTNNNAWMYLGSAYKQQSQLAKAASAFENAVRYAPNDVEAWEALAQVNAGKGSQIDAIPIYLRALEVNPESTDLLVSLASKYYEIGLWDFAQDTQEKAVKLLPADYPKEKKKQLYIDLGILHRNLGRFAVALEDFKMALDIDPRSSFLMISIGEVYTVIEEYDLAINYFERAQNIDENTTFAWVGKAGVYHKQGHLDEALVAYEKGLEENNPQPEALHMGIILNNIGVIYFTKGDYRKAIEHFQQAMIVFPELRFSVLSTNLGSAYAQLGEYQEAEIALAAAIASNPNNADSWNNQGVLEIILNRYDKAQQSFTIATQLDPTNILAHRNSLLLERKLAVKREQTIAEQEAEKKMLLEQMSEVKAESEVSLKMVHSLTQQLQDYRYKLEELQSLYQANVSTLEEHSPEDPDESYFIKVMIYHLKRIYFKHMAIALGEASPNADFWHKATVTENRAFTILDILGRSVFPPIVSLMFDFGTSKLVDLYDEKRKMQSVRIVSDLLDKTLREAETFMNEISKEVADMFTCFLPHLKGNGASTLAFAAVTRIEEAMPDVARIEFENPAQGFVIALLRGRTSYKLEVKNPLFEGLTSDHVFHSMIMVNGALFGIEQNQNSHYYRTATSVPPTIFGYKRIDTEVVFREACQ